MHHDIPAVARQRKRNRAANAFGGAGHKSNFLLVWFHRKQIKYNTAMQLQLPEPGADALLASRALQQLITEEIRQRGGWISFARYMELVLYAPELGYYSGGAAKLGKDGDFTTAPEITPLFGATLAHLATELMAQTEDIILEFGAGTGKLAFDILTELKAAGHLPQHYFIVEVSAQLRARQQELLRDFPQVSWLDRLPLAFSGVVFGNEVLDAIPVNLLLKSADGWLERGVTLDDAGRFAFAERAVEPVQLAQWLAQIPDAAQLDVGYLTEIHPVAQGFMQSLSSMLLNGNGGAAILFDYGFPAHEYYFFERAQGTLMCHYRHHAHDDPFYLPGLQDVTAHVDFTAIARVAVDAGLEVFGYTSQAAFLLNAGIGDLLLRTSPEQPQIYLPQANAVQKLISPAEMGELFKVLSIGKNVDWPARLQRHDRSHRL